MFDIVVVEGQRWGWPHAETWKYSQNICSVCMSELHYGYRQRCRQCNGMTCAACTYLDEDEPTQPGRPDSCRSCWSTD